MALARSLGLGTDLQFRWEEVLARTSMFEFCEGTGGDNSGHVTEASCLERKWMHTAYNF